MKGIMVLLLISVMTGIVVGQQSESDSFRTTVYRPDTYTGTQGADNFSPQVDQSRIKPFDLSVSDIEIQGIRNSNAKLESKIEPRDPNTGELLPLSVISGITLIHKNNLNARVPVRTMRGEDAGNGLIRFGLDDWALKDLEKNKLSFEFAEADRGRFNQIAFYYKPPAASPTPDDGPQSTRVPFGPQPQQPQQGQIGFLPAPGPEALPGDVNFEGPVIPTGVGQVAGNNGGNNQFGGNSSNAWNIPQDNPQQESLAQFKARLQREEMAREFAKEELRKESQRQELARIQRENNAQQNQLGGTNWSTNNNQTFPPRQTAPVINPSNQPGLTNQQIADQLAIMQKQQLMQAQENDLAVRNQAMIAKETELERLRQEMVNQRFLASQDNPPRYSTPTGPVTGTNYRPTGPVLEAPERIASRNNDDIFGNFNRQTPVVQPGNGDPRSRGGVGNLIASIPATGNGTSLNANANPNDASTQLKKERRAEGFIYFMLLCSLGLNVYLSLISRGFYVRYNELADELRETFTATM